MENYFKKISFLFCLIILIPKQYTLAKDFIQAKEPDLPQAKYADEEEAFKHQCDSLILNNNYREAIALCQQQLNDSTGRSIAMPYLIGALYFTGDSVQSRNLLMDEIKNLSFIQIAFDYLTSDNVSLIRYFDIKQNRDPVLSFTVEKYKKIDSIKYKSEGAEILRFFINDQRIRKLKYGYEGASETFFLELNNRKAVEDSLQNSKIYTFYKRHGRYFSEKEVGLEVCYLQPIFFSHIADVRQRQTFFKSILENAVKKGIIRKEKLVNFILRTESLTNKDFFKTINDRLPEIRKQYNLPDSYYFTTF